MSRASRSGQQPEVQSITSVPESFDDEQARRTRQYLIQMAIRLVCFGGAVVALTGGRPVLGWALAAGAIVLPYTAVIFVNAPNRKKGSAEAYVAPAPATLPAPGDDPGPGPSPDARHVIIDGDTLLDGVRDEPVEKKN